MSQTNRPSRGRILPREQGAAPLDVVIAVMAFLAALAIGASLVAHRAAQGWQEGLSGSLTVQILPPEKGPPQPALDNQTNLVVQILRNTQGIASATPVSKEDAMKLVKPWLGSDALVADLPLPRLVDAQIIPGARVDLPALSAQLKKAVPDSILDDHSHWLSRLKLLADTVMWASYIILALIAIATASIVAFATRAGLQAHHNIVALLHQMGAHSSFIARAFERHYFVSTLAASAIGAALAGMVFLLASWLEFAGIEPVPFLPPLALHLVELVWLVAVPLGAGLIAWATARLSVLAALRKIY
jgi:cell division transport system permease protein